MSREWNLDCGSDSGHRGIDIAAVHGAEVRSAAAGTVSFTGYTPAEGGGLTVTVSHPGGLKTTYLHLASLSVVSGQVVAQGQSLGLAAGPVLHFGLKLEAPRELYFNPLAYLPAREPGRSPGSSGPPGHPALSPAPVAGDASSGAAPGLQAPDPAPQPSTPGAAAAPDAASALAGRGAGSLTAINPGYAQAAEKSSTFPGRASTSPLDGLVNPPGHAPASSKAGIVPQQSSQISNTELQNPGPGTLDERVNPRQGSASDGTIGFGRGIMISVALAILLGSPVLASRLNRKEIGKGLTAVSHVA